MQAWQKARELTAGIYDLTRTGEFAKDYALRDQIRRAAISVMSNLAEGFERSSRQEFHQFLSIAKGSCAEVRSQLYTALDAGLIDNEEFSKAMACAESTANLIGAFRSSIARSLKPPKA
jgi:four helix bundle protein